MSQHSKLAKDIKTLRIATWNIWFDECRMEKRMNSIMNIISNHKIDIFCFQELTQKSLEYLQAHDYIQKENTFYISSSDIADIGNYGNIIFSKYPISNVNILQFNATNMSRKLVTADININNETFKICTTHLESLANNRALRISQLSQSIKFLMTDNSNDAKTKIDHYIFCGDFNECGTINDDVLPFPDTQFKDCWIDYHDKDWKKTNPGWTMAEMNGFAAWRPDRIYHAFNYDYSQKSYKEFIFEDEESKGMKQDDNIPLLDLDMGLDEDMKVDLCELNSDNETSKSDKEKEESKDQEMGKWKLVNAERIGMKDIELDKDEKDYKDKLSILTPSDHYGVLVEFEWCSM